MLVEHVEDQQQCPSPRPKSPRWIRISLPQPGSDQHIIVNVTQSGGVADATYAMLTASRERESRRQVAGCFDASTFASEKTPVKREKDLVACFSLPFHASCRAAALRLGCSEGGQSLEALRRDREIPWSPASHRRGARLPCPFARALAGCRSDCGRINWPH